MSLEQAMKSIEVGLEIIEKEVPKGLDIVGTGDMGIGNTTPSSAITAAITGEEVVKVTGRGTGLDDKQLVHKVEIIERALKVNKPNPDDAIDVLAKVGGFEIGGLSGVILGAAAHRIPVVIDGFVSGAAALIAVGLSPKVKDYLIASHCSVEIGHKAILKYLGLRPILDLELRLGEGTGAALGIFVVESAAKILADMATFAEAGVSERDDEGAKPLVKEG
jgi:nicotinate-nucleotide--dimethylbenzimidazole phosphoribosyltransferase